MIESFKIELLREFNECRVDPKSYAKKIENHLAFIRKNHEPREGSLFFYDKGNGPKVSLSYGIIKFKECIDYLNTLIPMPPLKLCPDLTVKVPKAVSDWARKEVFRDLFKEKKDILKDKYYNFQFHFDIGYIDAEISAVLQIVDDNQTFNGARRNSILNKDLHHVGISNQKNGKKNCVYVLFANKSDNY